MADTWARNKSWDHLEGVLFLSRPEGADAPVLAEVVEPPTAQTFVFTKSH